MKIFIDWNWRKNKAWRKQGKLRRGFAWGPLIVLFKDK